MGIHIELDAHEAHLMIAPLTNAVIEDQAEAAKTSGEASEYAGLRAQVRSRVLSMIVDGMTPPEDPARVILREQVELGML